MRKRKSSFVEDYFPSINLSKPWISSPSLMAIKKPYSCFFHIFLESWREKCIHTGGCTPNTQECRSRNPNPHFQSNCDEICATRQQSSLSPLSWKPPLMFVCETVSIVLTPEHLQGFSCWLGFGSSWKVWILPARWPHKRATSLSFLLRKAWSNVNYRWICLQ